MSSTNLIKMSTTKFGRFIISKIFTRKIRKETGSKTKVRINEIIVSDIKDGKDVKVKLELDMKIRVDE